MTTQQRNLTSLDYAPLAGLRRRKRRRWAISVLLAVVVITTLYFGVPSAWRRYSDRARYRRLAAWSAPSDQLVYARDPIAPARIHGLPTTCATTFGEVALREVPETQLDRHVIYTIPRATAFVQGFRAANGPWLLIVEIPAESTNDPQCFTLEWRLRSRDGSRVRAGSYHVPLLQDRELAGVRNAPVRFFAGQRDPSDEHHFTIGYEYDGRTGTIDGWIVDDESVTLRVRDLAAEPGTTP